MLKEKKEWLIDLLELVAFHPHFNGAVLAEAWKIPKKLAVEVVVTAAMALTEASLKKKPTTKKRK